METAQKERQLYPPLLLPWPAGSKPLEYTLPSTDVNARCGHKVSLASEG